MYKLRSISGCYRWAVDPWSLEDADDAPLVDMQGTVASVFGRTPSHAGRRVYTATRQTGERVHGHRAKGEHVHGPRTKGEHVPRPPSGKSTWASASIRASRSGRPSTASGTGGGVPSKGAPPNRIESNRFDSIRSPRGRVKPGTAPTGSSRLSTGYGLPKPRTAEEGRASKRRASTLTSHSAETVIPEGGLRNPQAFGGGLLSRKVEVRGCVVVKPQMPEDVRVAPSEPSGGQKAAERLYVQCDVCMAAYPLKGAPGRKATCTLCGERFVTVAKALRLHESLKNYPTEMASVWK